VAFVHRVVQVHPHTPLVSLPTAEQGLFDKARHVRPAGSAPDVYSFPVVVVGGYGAHGPIEDPSVLVYPSVAGTATRYQTYEDIQHLMVAGKGQFWVREFNAYANVVTALICYQDGFRPKAVCDRPVVRAILKGAK
jgi:hypothetical protein